MPLSRRWPRLTFLLDYEIEQRRIKGLAKAKLKTRPLRNQLLKNEQGRRTFFVCPLPFSERAEPPEHEDILGVPKGIKIMLIEIDDSLPGMGQKREPGIVHRGTGWQGGAGGIRQ